MDIQKRLFRRPFTTVLWGLLVTAMALLLCVGAALWYSSENLVTTLDGMYTAAAFRTNKSVTSGAGWTQVGEKHLMQEDVDFLESLDCVEEVLFHTLTGGYSPSFVPVLNRSFSYEATSTCTNESYDDMLVVGTLQGNVQNWPCQPRDLSYIGHGKEEVIYSVSMDFLVEDIILRHPGYQGLGFGKGSTITVHFDLVGEDTQNFLQKGQRYVICGELAFVKDILNSANSVEILEGNSLVGYQFSTNLGERIGLLVRPTAAKLEGSLEEFLAEPENGIWREYIQAAQMAHHCLPLIGTDNLNSMYAFLNHDVSIAEGRTFSQEEYDTGAKVCIISESLAQSSGLGVGDTVLISQYLLNELGWNHSLEGAPVGISTDGKENNPTVGEFESGTEFVTENEEFTVIGIYRKSNGWDQGAWSFTVNTVFLPKKAQIPGGYGAVSTLERIPVEFVPGEKGIVNAYTDRGNFGLYLTVLLKKGHMEEFDLALANTALYGEFFTLDQGYEAMIGSVKSVGETSRKLLWMSAAGWCLLLALYVLLFQGGQKKNIGIMRSLGAKPGEGKRYLFNSGMYLAGAGVLLGTALSWLVMQLVNGKLQQQMLENSTGTQFSSGQAMSDQALTDMIGGSQLPLWGLLALAAAQLAVFVFVLWLHADALARKKPRKLMGV